MLQYFQMDPKKYDDVGIDHAKFCFQVIWYCRNIWSFHIFLLVELEYLLKS
jgi:hypothetical protein